MSGKAPDYQYEPVRNLAAAFLPHNREREARQVDAMLAGRDKKIEQLQSEVNAAEDQLKLAREELGLLRNFIEDTLQDRVRAIFAATEHALAAFAHTPRSRQREIVKERGT